MESVKGAFQVKDFFGGILVWSQVVNYNCDLRLDDLGKKVSDFLSGLVMPGVSFGFFSFSEFFMKQKYPCNYKKEDEYDMVFFVFWLSQLVSVV